MTAKPVKVTMQPCPQNRKDDKAMQAWLLGVLNSFSELKFKLDNNLVERITTAKNTPGGNVRITLAKSGEAFYSSYYSYDRVKVTGGYGEGTRTYPIGKDGTFNITKLLLFVNQTIERWAKETELRKKQDAGMGKSAADLRTLFRALEGMEGVGKTEEWGTDTARIKLNNGFTVELRLTPLGLIVNDISLSYSEAFPGQNHKLETTLANIIALSKMRFSP